MNSDETTFTPEHLDEQIAHPADWLALDDQRLLQDLQGTCQPYEHQNAQSLHAVWNRLAQERQKQFAQDTTTTQTVPLSSLKSKRTIKGRLSLANPSSSGFKRTLSLLVAVIMVTVLVGSAVILFNILGKRHAQSNTAFDNLRPTSVAVTDASGIYITYQTDLSPHPVVSKLDIQTHKAVWVYQNSLSDVGTLLAYGDAIYLNATDIKGGQARLIALNIKTGKELWNVSVKANVIRDESGNSPYIMSVLTSPVVSDGHVFVMNRAGTVFSFEAKTGKENWTYETGTSALFRQYYTNTTTGQKKLSFSGIYDGGTPVISNGVLYGTLKNVYFAVNANTGKQIWSSRLAEQNHIFTDIQVVDNVIYAASFIATHGYNPDTPQQNYVYAFNARDGSQIWKYSAKDWVTSAPEVNNGYVYFIEGIPSEVTVSGNSHSTLHVLNAQGHEVWHKDYNVDVSGLTVGEGYVCVQANVYDHTSGKLLTSTLYVYDATSGNGRAKKVTGDPSTIQNGVLYMQSGSKIIAYDIKSLQVLWHDQYGLVDKASNHSAELYQVVVVP